MGHRWLWERCRAVWNIQPEVKYFLQSKLTPWSQSKLCMSCVLNSKITKELKGLAAYCSAFRNYNQAWTTLNMFLCVCGMWLCFVWAVIITVVCSPSVAALLVYIVYSSTLLSTTISVCLIVIVSISKGFQKLYFAQNSKGQILFKMMETFQIPSFTSFIVAGSRPSRPLQDTESNSPQLLDGAMCTYSVNPSGWFLFFPQLLSLSISLSTSIPQWLQHGMPLNLFFKTSQRTLVNVQSDWLLVLW